MTSTHDPSQPRCLQTPASTGHPAACRSRTGALELTALSLKATGSYLSRTLAYTGAKFKMCHIDMAARFRWAGGQAGGRGRCIHALKTALI